MTPTWKATPFTVVYLIHCRRVRRRNLLAKGCPPYVYLPDDCLLLTRISLKYYLLFYYSGGKFL
ncbi:MAG: hypothetical protein LBK82_05890 [Planctomycetaceae bacterium]|nr:hypothetical protein [Planctomycetaceae bacterium]